MGQIDDEDAAGADGEENFRKAQENAAKLLELEKQREERRKKIKELEQNILEMYESGEDSKLKIKPAYIEPVIEPLAPAQLSENISRSLVPENPYVDITGVYFDYKKGEYRNIFTSSKELLLYEMTGCIQPANSTEADEIQNRIDVDEMWREQIAKRNEDTKKKIEDKVQLIKDMKRRQLKGEDEEEAEEEMGEEEAEEEEEAKTKRQSQAVRASARMSYALDKKSQAVVVDWRVVALSQKKFFNRFNFSDRSVLTYETLVRDKETQTVDTQRRRINGQAAQWLINQTYEKDYKEQQEAKERERLAKMTLTVVKEDKTKRKPRPEEEIIYKRLADGVLYMERMLNQNIYDNIAQDCKFYEDPADRYRDEEGVVLPLWEFSYREAKSLAVTDVKWNPAYKDMFGVSFGPMDFIVESPHSGYLCVFTLKNPSYPEFVKQLDTGATCLDFHPKKCHYVCIGLEDGGVMAFNTQLSRCDTQYRSRVDGGCRGMVGDIVWSHEEGERLKFFSAGADGMITAWMLHQNELLSTHVITLLIDKRDLTSRLKELETPVAATALAFHPKEHHIYMVGTRLGTIYKCSTSYASDYFYQIKAHDLPVRRISYNPYVTDIFATCGGDWRVKIWEDGRLEPLFLYNLDNPVCDVQWAPYSSTVLAALTSAGKVYIYDLNMDKTDPICAQYVVCVDDNTATRLHFNPFGIRMPLILLGDSTGVITTIKLSPNLRVKPKPPKKTDLSAPVDDFTYEVRKLDKILSFVKEPLVLKLPNEDEMRNLVE